MLCLNHVLTQPDNTSIWLRKNCNDIFTYQESDTYFQAMQLSCKCNYSEFGHITVLKLIYVQN